MTTASKTLTPIFAGTVIPVRVSVQTQAALSTRFILHLDPNRPERRPASKEAIANFGGTNLECEVIEVRDPKRSILVKLTGLLRADGKVPFQCNHQDVFEPLGVMSRVSPQQSRMFFGNDRKGWGFIGVDSEGGFDLDATLSPKDDLAFILGATIFIRPQ